MLALVVLLSLLFVDLSLSGPTSRRSTSVLQSSRSDSTKYVIAHFVVGNAFPYTQADWQSDIGLAHLNGIDGFVLNVGSNPWEPQQVAYAYQAALESNTGFKLFISFDMTSLPCKCANDTVTLKNYITTYASHPNQLIYNGRVLATTFSGESCKFGQHSVQKGWSTQFLQQLSGNNAVYFVPSFFVVTSRFHKFSSIIDGMLNWNSAWPTKVTKHSVSNYGPLELDSLAVYVGATTSDEDYLSTLGNATYIPTVSPWFFTHYSRQTYNKNWIYLSDDHLYVTRWQNLIGMRDKFDIVQVNTWNDYGESHYIGPIEGAQPDSQAWVDGFDHTGWLEMTSYFATAFKTGTYPNVPADQIFMWSRPHPAFASAPDPVARPKNYQITADKMWAVVLATSDANVTLSTSANESQTFEVPAGMTKLSLGISAGGYMQAVLQRNGQTVVNIRPSNFTFNPTPPSYNYNAFVAAS